MNEEFANWANLVLIWVGFGTLVGLLAKAIMPGRDPGSALATVIIGILGTIIGAGILQYFSPNLRVTPISPMGFVVAIVGTSLLLFTYRLLQGSILKEDGLFRWKRGGRGRKITVTEK